MNDRLFQMSLQPREIRESIVHGIELAEERENRIRKKIGKLSLKNRIRKIIREWNEWAISRRPVRYTQEEILTKKFFLKWRLKAMVTTRYYRPNSASSGQSDKIYRFSDSEDEVQDFFKTEEKKEKQKKYDTPKNWLSSKNKLMETSSALSALGLTTVRGLDDSNRGPGILSFSFAAKVHHTEELRHLKLISNDKHLPEEIMSQPDILEKLREENYKRFTTTYTRNELNRIHEAYQTLRLKYKNRYQELLYEMVLQNKLPRCLGAFYHDNVVKFTKGKLPQPQFIGAYTRIPGDEEESFKPQANQIQFKDWGVLLEGRTRDHFLY